MKMYNVEGIFKGHKICKAIVDSGYPNKVRIELWSKKRNFEKIPLGESHYNKFIIEFENEKDYLSLLLNKKFSSTVRKYLRKLNLKVLGRFN